MARSTTATDTPDTPGDAAVEVSDSGVDTSTLTEAQKAIRDFKPVKLSKGDKTVEARTQAQRVALEFDGYAAADEKKKG